MSRSWRWGLRYWTEMKRLESTGTRIVRLNGGAPVTRGWYDSLEAEVGCLALLVVLVLPK